MSLGIICSAPHSLQHRGFTCRIWLEQKHRDYRMQKEEYYMERMKRSKE